MVSPVCLFALVMHAERDERGTRERAGAPADQDCACGEVARRRTFERDMDHILTQSDMTAVDSCNPTVIPCRDPLIGIRHAFDLITPRPGSSSAPYGVPKAIRPPSKILSNKGLNAQAGP